MAKRKYPKSNYAKKKDYQAKILTYPDDRLKVKCTTVTDFASVADICSDLKRVLKATRKGIGLSANQLGYDKRVIIVDYNNKPVVMINPAWIKAERSLTEELVERCLSYPCMRAVVKRYKDIAVTYYDETGHFHRLLAEGMAARIIQHEVDHLDGVCEVERGV